MTPQKYPRTWHLPISNATSDDRQMDSFASFEGKRVMIMEKMDGENTSLYRDHFHARSLDSRHHFSRDFVKSYWAAIRHEIPEGIKLTGENLWAKHTIHYKQLRSYFLVFGAWDSGGLLSVDDFIDLVQEMGLHTPKTFYLGTFNQKFVETLAKDIMEGKHGDCEGFVMRTVDYIPNEDFSKCVGKFVIPNFVQTADHWIHSEIIKNELKNGCY